MTAEPYTPSDDLRILILEDMPMDAELLEYELRRANIEFVARCVDTREAFLEALDEFHPHVILSDYTLPRFDGMAALALAKELVPDTPLLIVTGSVNEETAVGCMKAGAADYLLKGNLSRIGPAIEAAMVRAQARERQRRAEQALATSERRFRSLVQNSSDLVIVLREDGNILYTSDSASRIVGRAPRTLIGTDLLSLLEGAERDAMEALLSQHSAIGTHPLELTLCTPDGVPVRLEAIATDLRADSAIGGIVLNARDVSERKRAELVLRESEERYRSLFDNASDLVCMAASDGSLVYLNPAWHLATGYSPDELAKRRLADLLHSDSRVSVEAALQRVLAGEAVTHLEAVVVAQSGEALMLEGSLSGLLKDGSVAMVCAIFRDVTERRRMEDHLRRAERMQAAGRLAGGVAHEVNNMMTGVIGFASLLRTSFPEGDPRLADVREILRAAGRAADLTRQLLAFTRQQLRRVETLDLNDIITELERMLRRTVGEEHEFVLRLHPDAVRVAADRGQIEQVLINLTLNARDALTGQGRVSVETGIATLDASYAMRHPGVAVPAGHYVMLAVSDTGCGMSREVLTRIFEPFFTTKPVGKGTGLGLSTVYGIVKQSDGFIWAYSEPDAGSVFKVYLPVASSDTDRTSEHPAAPVASHGTERLLIVEDEEIVRSMACRGLREQGYQVAEAADGVAALEYLERHAAEIDLIISDVVMPAMGGREFGKRLAALAPTIPILYISGFAGDDVVDRGLLDPGAPFLQKPFPPDALALKVRELLDRARATA